jgi:hypothetical protein
MGRQFSFFLLPSDANALVGQLRCRFGSKFLVDYSPAYDLFEVVAPFLEGSAGTLEPVSLSNRFYLAPQATQLARKFYPKPNWWAIDSDSEGIEFSGCDFDGTTVLIGRLWYQRDFVKDMHLASKSSEFLKWAEAVFRYAKRFLSYEAKIDAYVGEAAMKFRQNGGLFTSTISPDGRIASA